MASRTPRKRSRFKRDSRTESAARFPERRLPKGHRPAPRPVRQDEPEARVTGFVRR